jgi:multidrug efflux pump subunit AcrB
VSATLVAEVYDTPDKSYQQLIESATYVKAVMSAEPFVVDIDDTAETSRDRIDFVLDKEKAALDGVSTDMITRTLKMSLSGDIPATVHTPGERQALPVKPILPRAKRAGIEPLSQIPVKTRAGKMILLAEIGSFAPVPEDQPIYHKNLDRVVYVFGEMAGQSPLVRPF